MGFAASLSAFLFLQDIAYRAASLLANYPEFPDSCFRLRFAIGVALSRFDRLFMS